MLQDINGWPTLHLDKILMILCLLSYNSLESFLPEVMAIKQTMANTHSSGNPLFPAVTDSSLTTKLIHTKIFIFTEHLAITAY